jgi:hypothetical protein
MAYCLSPALASEDMPDQDDDHLSYQGMRIKQEPGDISFTGPDGNFFHLRRGGYVEVGATPRAKATFVPVANLLRMFYDRIQHITPLGEFSWDYIDLTPAESTSAEDSNRAVILKGGFREKIGQKQLALEIRIGRLDTNTLDTALDSNLLHEGKTSSVTVLGEEGEETIELPAGSGDLEHLFATKMEHPQETGPTAYNPEDEEDSPPGILSVVLTDADDNSHKLTFQIRRDGAIFAKLSAPYHVEVASVYVRASDRVTIETQYGARQELKDYVKLQTHAALFEMLGSGDIIIQGTSITLAAAALVIGGGGGAGGAGGAGGRDLMEVHTNEAGEVELVFDVDVVRFGGRDARQDLVVDGTSMLEALREHVHDSDGVASVGASGNTVTTSETRTKIYVKR